ncbi:MAG: gamma-glutamyltransferase [Legionella sp.]|nr:gamma-glutamyltransferase [Legionella sp.]
MPDITVLCTRFILHSSNGSFIKKKLWRVCLSFLIINQAIAAPVAQTEIFPFFFPTFSPIKEAQLSPPFKLTTPSKEPANHQAPRGYAVATAHPLATEAGLDILAAGGNAFDAAVAISAVLGVVEPYHSGLGGGGFWLLHDAETKKNILIDARETAPGKASRDMFLDKNKKPIPGSSLNGGLSAAIPGEPAALVFISKHYGRLPLSTVLAPAIRLAENGFVVNQAFRDFVLMEDRLKTLQRFPASAETFLKEGRAYKRGDCLKQPALANTLRQIAEKGRDGFYRGIIAERLVKGVNAAGGIWTLEDLANYRLKIRKPLTSTFHNMTIVTTPLPSAGGVALVNMLNILSAYTLNNFSKETWVHYLVEAMRLAFWQRDRYLADPDFIDVPLDDLLSVKHAAKLRQLIPLKNALPSQSLQEKSNARSQLTAMELKTINKQTSDLNQAAHHTSSAPANLQKKISSADLENIHTTSIAVLDKEGNRVAATMTVNYIFGSSVVPKDTGVLINNEMDEFSIKPGEKNIYGIVGTEKNAIQPGKRPLSNMAPTFLEMPNRIAIAGTPGGSRIPTMMLLAALSFYDYGGAIRMVSAMRFHHQYLPDYLQVEPETFSPSLQAALVRRGYHLMMLNQYYGDMQAITWDKQRNYITAASDPRHVGVAVTVSADKGGYGFSH